MGQGCNWRSQCRAEEIRVRPVADKQVPCVAKENLTATDVTPQMRRHVRPGRMLRSASCKLAPLQETYWEQAHDQACRLPPGRCPRQNAAKRQPSVPDWPIPRLPSRGQFGHSEATSAPAPSSRPPVPTQVRMHGADSCPVSARPASWSVSWRSTSHSAAVQPSH